MKFGVVIFPGSNCDKDVIYVLKDILKQEVVSLWHKDRDLKGCDFIILPGGLSFGDHFRSKDFVRCSPIMEEVLIHAAKGGYLLGICNGFQVLCEAGLTPGMLTHNTSRRFICKNTNIKAITNNSIITASVDLNKVLNIPFAHAQGRYLVANEVLDEILENDQILYKYCDAEGKLTEESNPNGSLLNIAGVCNKKRNVFGIMPHIERACDPEIRNTDGRIIFDSILNSLK